MQITYNKVLQKYYNTHAFTCSQNKPLDKIHTEMSSNIVSIQLQYLSCMLHYADKKLRIRSVQKVCFLNNITNYQCYILFRQLRISIVNATVCCQ